MWCSLHTYVIRSFIVAIETGSFHWIIFIFWLVFKNVRWLRLNRISLLSSIGNKWRRGRNLWGSPYRFSVRVLVIWRRGWWLQTYKTRSYHLAFKINNLYDRNRKAISEKVGNVLPRQRSPWKNFCLFLSFLLKCKNRYAPRPAYMWQTSGRQNEYCRCPTLTWVHGVTFIKVLQNIWEQQDEKWSKLVVFE